MTTAPITTKSDKDSAEVKTLSIDVEPSPPLILAMAQLFRSYKQPSQAIELCLHGLKFFPGNLGLRLSLALGYKDLDQKEQAWGEITTIGKDLHQLSPVLEKIAEYSVQDGQTRLSEWFTRLSQVLAQYPVDPQETKKPPEPAQGNKVGLPVGKDHAGPPPEEEPIPESHVLSTLNDWLSQVKKDNP